jgi:sporulation protein YlmC with PRC-barrel domain
MESKMADVDALFDQSHELVSSARVEGTPVFDPDGKKLGSVHSVMIHKTTGQVAYAVLSFGGFLGIGGHVYPIPWEMLTYDPHRNGYITTISQDQLAEAPSLRLDGSDRLKESEGPMYAYWDTSAYW